MTVRTINRNDAMLETLLIQWITDFQIADAISPAEGKVMNVFTLDRQVRFYDFKQLSPEGEAAQITRPCVIMQFLPVADGNVPATAGSGMPRLARCGVIVAVECPVTYDDGSTNKGGRDNLLQPVAAAIENWFDDNASVIVPDSIRFEDGDPAKAVIFPPEVLDVNKATQFMYENRRRDFERVSFNITLENLEIS